MPGWTPSTRLRSGLPRFALPNASHRPVVWINARHLTVLDNNLRAACRLAPTYRTGDRLSSGPRVAGRVSLRMARAGPKRQEPGRFA
jgi:hypothetical protein